MGGCFCDILLNEHDLPKVPALLSSLFSETSPDILSMISFGGARYLLKISYILPDLFRLHPLIFLALKVYVYEHLSPLLIELCLTSSYITY